MIPGSASPAASLLSRFAALLRNENGNALVELGVVFGILSVPFLLGTGEMGIVVYDSIEISNAANAGASYGMQSLTNAANTASITSAAQAEATNFGTALAVTPTTYYACATAVAGTQYTGASAQSTATAACTGTGNRAIEFVQVKTSATVTPSIHCPGLPTSFTLNGFAVMEVEP